MYSKENIIRDIKALGVVPGDMVFLRVSYKSIGKVEGGPQTVLDAIMEVVGCNGTIIATAFPKRIQSFGHRYKKKAISKLDNKPATGVLPVLMVQHPNSFLSKNSNTPYVIIGRDANIIANAHTNDKDAYYIVEYIIKNYHPKCLRIGGRVLDGTTHLAFSDGLKNTNSYQLRVGEGMYCKEDSGDVVWCSKNVSSFCYDKFEEFFNTHLRDKAVLAEGKVGNGSAMITDMAKTNEIEYLYIAKDPTVLQCSNPHCVECRCAYSFSENSILGYIWKEIKFWIRTHDKKSINRIKDALKLLLFGERCQ